jgi:hypothetical protein
LVERFNFRCASRFIWSFICEYIVRFEEIRLFNAVNVELRHRALNILSPREVATHEDD